MPFNYKAEGLKFELDSLLNVVKTGSTVIPFKLNEYKMRDYNILSDTQMIMLIRNSLLHPRIMNNRDKYSISNKTINEVRKIKRNTLKDSPIGFNDYDIDKVKPYYMEFIPDTEEKCVIYKVPFLEILERRLFWPNDALNTQFKTLDPNICTYNEMLFKYWTKYDWHFVHTPEIMCTLRRLSL